MATEDDTRFVKWTNAGGETLSTDNPFTFTVKRDTALRAHFEAYAFSEVINGTVYNLDVDAHTAAVSSTNKVHNMFASLVIPQEVRTAGGQLYAVTALNAEAFRGNGKLKSVTIPGSIGEWGAGVFRQCDSLQSVTFGEGLKSIGAEAFPGCSSLASVTIPNGLTRIRKGAFSACTGLQDIELEWDSPDRGTVDADAFAGVPASCRVHIPRGSEDRYGYDRDLKAVWQGLPVVSDRYAVGVASGDTAVGRVTGGGNRMVLYAETTLTADADSGYHFVKWTNADGSLFSVANPHTFVVTGDMSVQAHFAVNNAVYTVKLSAVNGKIMAGDGVHDYDTEIEAVAEADYGYHFVKWVNVAGDSVSGSNPYRFVLTEETELTAVFTKDTDEPLTGFGTLLGVETLSGVYYAEGVLRLANLKGYFISVSTLDGRQVLQFRADSDDERYAAALPAGIYVLNAARGKEERHVGTKFVVK
ncbi:hypothetical protein Barb7_02484 [Bacteroidales bacterium Barb7]|nr:hypothetical protein Barb7_02484 [Bacteroidales bacterium Barb7]